MADLLAYWRYDNYLLDVAEGVGFNFNSRQDRLHSVLNEGDSLWLITGRRETGRVRMAYYVVARLVIRAKTFNAPDYKYGTYRVWGDLKASTYYQVGSQEVSALLKHLQFSTHSPIGETDRELALHFQSMRQLSSEDTVLLDRWCSSLPLEPAAFEMFPEYQLEVALEKDEEAIKKVFREHHSGIAEYRVDHLVQKLSRSKVLSRQIHQMYQGRCQICGFDPPVLVYGVEACQSHHLTYLSRGGDDSLDNIVLLCPNHHNVIHATEAVFDFRDLSFVFAPHHRERLTLNSHLNANS